MKTITLADLRAALRATSPTPPTPYALALRAALAASFLGHLPADSLLPRLSPADTDRSARDLLSAARSPAGYSYGPIPAADPRWDRDPAGFAEQECAADTPSADMTAIMTAFARLDSR